MNHEIEIEIAFRFQGQILPRCHLLEQKNERRIRESKVSSPQFHLRFRE